MLLVSGLDICATHNRAGDITYEQIGPLTIRATITTYTRTSSFGADRDSLEMVWGDGTSNFIKRSNGFGEELPNDIKVNYYIGEHTYTTRGTYTMSVTDPNRIAGILNIDFPNSVNIQFHLATTFTLLDPRFQGRNSSVILLQPPIDYACVGQVYTYNPNAYDPDGDSITYELITPFQEAGSLVPNYQLPDRIAPGPNNIARLDPITGDFVWATPQLQGEFNITYRINEYRQGVLINSIIRDMQILVRICPDENRPPEIDLPTEICVIAGTLIDLEVIGTDRDSFEILEMTVLGGPFELDISPATFTSRVFSNESRVVGRFTWQTDCEHISAEAYQVVFRVTDAASKPNTALATLKTLLIRVLAPAPEVKEITFDNGRIRLSWEEDYPCKGSTNFRGFSVWRRAGSQFLNIDSCRGGLGGLGYEKIVFSTAEIENGEFVSYDLDIDGADIWCYRVLGEYARLTDGGNPFNPTTSLRSEELCILANREKPLMTHASVRTTDNVVGIVDVVWYVPGEEDIDQNRFPAPYSTELSTAPNLGGSGLNVIAGSRRSASVMASLDTSFSAGNLNTVLTPHSFRVELSYQQDRVLSDAHPASTVFLSSRANDKRAILSWDFNVPWTNFSYEIYEITDSGQRIFRERTPAQETSIFGLTNGVEYCFQVEAYGRYNIIEINDPLINWSQVSCVIPVDSLPPCSPMISVTTVCDRDALQADLINFITWRRDSSCDDDDIVRYNVYFSPSVNGGFEFLSSIDAGRQSFEHIRINDIAGCYAVTAIDSSGNESEFSRVVCVDNCPSYELPNTFTPNNDNANDRFTPRIARFIDRVEFVVVNRWGQEVFRTSDPLINWDGSDNNGKKLLAGTYYYTCQLFEKRVDGVTPAANILTGYIHLIR